MNPETWIALAISIGSQVVATTIFVTRVGVRLDLLEQRLERIEALIDKGLRIKMDSDA